MVDATNQKIIEYGMSMVGNNIKLIKKHKFNELKKRISKGVKKKFELERILSEDEMEAILVGAAESFASSLFFIDRKGDARGNFKHFYPQKNKRKNYENK